jgi:hypothetical protein
MQKKAEAKSLAAPEMLAYLVFEMSHPPPEEGFFLSSPSHPPPSRTLFAANVSSLVNNWTND